MRSSLATSGTVYRIRSGKASRDTPSALGRPVPRTSSAIFHGRALQARAQNLPLAHLLNQRNGRNRCLLLGPPLLINPTLDFAPELQNRLTNSLGFPIGHHERDAAAHGATDRVELLMKITWEISRPDGLHFEERMLEPPQNRSVVRFSVVYFKLASGRLELLEYPEEPLPLEIEIEPLRHLPVLCRSGFHGEPAAQRGRPSGAKAREASLRRGSLLLPERFAGGVEAPGLTQRAAVTRRGRHAIGSSNVKASAHPDARLTLQRHPTSLPTWTVVRRWSGAPSW